MVLRAAVLALCLMFLPILVFAQGNEIKKEAATLDKNSNAMAEEIRSVLKNYTTAFEAKDINGVMAVFDDDPNTVMMGTGPDEIWAGKDDIRMAHLAFFANFTKESSERKLVSVNADGDVAWLTGYSVVTQQNEDGTATFQVNLSIVLERFEGIWYITVLHFSNLTGPA